MEPELPAHPPIVDLSDFDHRRHEIVAQLMKAATETGFFYISGHGIPQKLIDAAFGQAESFFSQPQTTKEALPRVDWAAAKVWGYELNKLTDGTLHESILMGHAHHEYMRDTWPQEDLLPGYKATALEFMRTMHPVACRLLSCFATGLGLPPDFFDKTTDYSSDENRTFLQYHKYPTTKGLKWKPGTNRITAHTDESLITLLHPSPGSVGLEVAAGKDGKAVVGQNGYHHIENWLPCPQLPNTIVVNIGDPLQIISDGTLKSNFHRVRMPKSEESQGDRYSMGYFIWPAFHDRIEGRLGVLPGTTMEEYFKTKGKMYADSFSPDAEVYESLQQYAFGLPEIKQAA